jgi:hypothetical protein
MRGEKRPKRSLDKDYFRPYTDLNCGPSMSAQALKSAFDYDHKKSSQVVAPVEPDTKGATTPVGGCKHWARIHPKDGEHKFNY